MAIGSPQSVSANVGKPFAPEDVEGVDEPAPVRALEDTELRDDCRGAGPIPERWPVSEPVAEAPEAVEGRVLPASDDGHSLRPPALWLWLAPLRASHAACCVAGREEVCETCVGLALPLGVAESVGPLFRPLELTLAGGAARLLREAAVLVLVVRDLATLAPSSSSPSPSSSDTATVSHVRGAELTVDCASAPPVFKGIDRSSWSGRGRALEPVARSADAVRCAYARVFGLQEYCTLIVRGVAV